MANIIIEEEIIYINSDASNNEVEKSLQKKKKLLMSDRSQFTKSLLRDEHKEIAQKRIESIDALKNKIDNLLTKLN